MNRANPLCTGPRAWVQAWARVRTSMADRMSMADAPTARSDGSAAQRAAEPDPLPLRFALHFLNIARDQLQLTTGHKGGHRMRAWLLLDQCAAEVRACMAHDRRNGMADEFARCDHAPGEPPAPPAPTHGATDGIT